MPLSASEGEGMLAQSPLPGYSDGQVALFIAAVIAGTLFVFVVVPVAVIGVGVWIGTRRAPQHRFVRFCMLAAGVAIPIGLLIWVYGEAVSPGSGLSFWGPVTALLGLWFVAVAVLLQRWE